MSYRFFFVTAFILGLHEQSESIPVRYLTQLLVLSHQGPFLFFLGVSSISISNAKVPEDCGSQVIIVEEADGVGDKGSGD
jgi:hypothetical protein